MLVFHVAITVLFIGFLLLASTVSLVDWRRGWLLALVAGVLQDPVRKLTPNTPVVLTFNKTDPSSLAYKP